jgi:hypothetical protein
MLARTSRNLSVTVTTIRCRLVTMVTIKHVNFRHSSSRSYFYHDLLFSPSQCFSKKSNGEISWLGLKPLHIAAKLTDLPKCFCPAGQFLSLKIFLPYAVWEGQGGWTDKCSDRRTSEIIWVYID